MHECGALGRDVFVIDKYFRIYFKNSLKPYGMNATEAMVLLALYARGGSIGGDVFREIHQKCKTQDQIISELQYDKAAMTRTMQSLERNGFVLRQSNPLDSRSFLFSATEKAERFKPVIVVVLRKWNDMLLRDVEQLDIAQAAVRQMAQNARQAIKGE